jgi:hypothetical protein
MSEHMNIWVVVINDHEGNINISLHPTLDAAEKVLKKYSADWWDEEEDYELYFEATDWESYKLVQYGIDMEEYEQVS